MRGAALLALALAGCGPAQAPPSNGANIDPIVDAKPVTLTAADGVRVFGRQVMPQGAASAMILLFHQAGSGKDEYAGIQDRLAEAGYASLAIDQRAGGSLYGTNETVKALGHPGSYLEAKQDLEAALAWARRRNLPIVLWGSSYSASLVFLVAAEHPGEVAALLAFSPGEYFDGKPAVKPYAAKLTIPIFVTSAQDPGEIAAAKALADAAPSTDKTQFVPTQGGVHGSSTLRPDRNPSGAAAAWTAVLGFLDRSVGKRATPAS